MKIFFNLLLLAACGILASGEPNAIVNGDFKLGPAGFGVWRLVRPEVNPKFENKRLSVEDGRLVLQNPYGEYFQLRSAEFNLPANTDVRFSTAFEGPAGALTFSVLRVSPAGKWFVHNRTVRSDGKTQKVEIRFNTKSESGAYLLVVHSPEKKTPAGTYRFSPFRLHAGGQSGEVSAALAVDKTLFTLGEEKNAGIRIALNNASERTLSGTLDFSIRDSLGKVFFRKKLPLELAPGNTVQNLQIPLTRSGFFSAQALWNGEKIPALRCLFSVIGKYRRETFADPANEFVVGFNGTLLYQTRGGSEGFTLYDGQTMDTPFEQLQKMGCRVLRDWDSGRLCIDWRQMEPEEGKYDFSYFDFVINSARRHGILIMPVVGRMYENWLKGQPEFRPDWLKPKLIQKPLPKGSNPKFVVKVPPKEIWERYVGAIAEHAGKRVSVYEIMNEPNLNMSPELYVEYLAYASKVLREKAPHATIIGICATGDLGGDQAKFMTPCIQLGARKYLDGITFHPYDARMLGSPVPADRQIAEVKSIAGDTPLWNSEIYYLYDWPNVVDGAGQRKPKAFHYAQRFLVDLGEGVKQSWSLHSTALWADPLHEEFITAYQTAPVPNDIFVAGNALARYFEGTRPVYKNKMTNGAVIYGYAGKDGAPIAAIWNWSGQRGLLADLSGFKAMDIFGNPVETGKAMTLTENPFYLQIPGLSADEFVKKLKNIAISLTSPFLISDVARVIGNNAHVRLTSVSDQPVEGEAGIRLPGYSSGPVVPFRIPAKGEIILVIPLIPGKADAKPELRIFCGSALQRFQIRKEESPVVRQGEKVSLGKDDFRATFQVKRTADELHLRVDVTDATDSGASLNGRNFWEVDGLELFFDMLPLELKHRHSARYLDSTFRVFVNPRLPEAEQLHAWTEKSHLKNRRISHRAVPTKDGYRVELEIPLGEFKNGEFIGFGIKINDRTESGKVRTLFWGAGDYMHKDRMSFGIVR